MESEIPYKKIREIVETNSTVIRNYEGFLDEMHILSSKRYPEMVLMMQLVNFAKKGEMPLDSLDLALEKQQGSRIISFKQKFFINRILSMQIETLQRMAPMLKGTIFEEYVNEALRNDRMKDENPGNTAHAHESDDGNR